MRINKRTEAIQKQGRNVQVNGQGTQILDMILNSESITDAVGRVQAISSIMTANNDLVKQQKEDKALVESKKSTIQTNLANVEKATLQLEKEQENLVAKQADLNVLKAEVDSETSGAESSKSKLLKEQQEALKAQLDKEAKNKEAKKLRLLKRTLQRLIPRKHQKKLLLKAKALRRTLRIRPTLVKQINRRIIPTLGITEMTKKVLDHQKNRMIK